ncbi:MAG TPA: hypothetical protein VF329_04225 [Gammaproteobacteria bacterium]
MKRDRDVFARDERAARIHDAAAESGVPVGSLALWREGYDEAADYWQVPKSTLYGWINPAKSANTRMGTAVTSSVPVHYIGPRPYLNVTSCQPGIDLFRNYAGHVSRANGAKGGRPRSKNL